MATWPSGLNEWAKKEKEKGVEGWRERAGIRLRRVLEGATTAHAFLGLAERCGDAEMPRRRSRLVMLGKTVVKRCSYWSHSRRRPYSSGACFSPFGGSGGSTAFSTGTPEIDVNFFDAPQGADGADATEGRPWAVGCGRQAVKQGLAYRSMNGASIRLRSRS